MMDDTGVEDLSSLLEDDEQENGFHTGAGHESEVSSHGKAGPASSPDRMRAPARPSSPSANRGAHSDGGRSGGDSARTATHASPVSGAGEGTYRGTGTAADHPRSRTPSPFPSADSTTAPARTPAHPSAQARTQDTVSAQGAAHASMNMRAGRIASPASASTPAPASAHSSMSMSAPVQTSSAQHWSGEKDHSPAHGNNLARLRPSAPSPASASARPFTPSMPSMSSTQSTPSPARTGSGERTGRTAGDDSSTRRGRIGSDIRSGGGAGGDARTGSGFSGAGDRHHPVSPPPLRPAVADTDTDTNARHGTPASHLFPSSADGGKTADGESMRHAHAPRLKPYGSDHDHERGNASPHRGTVSMPHASPPPTHDAEEDDAAAAGNASRQIGDIYRRDRTPESMTGPEAVRARHGRLTPRRYRMRGPDRTKRVRRDHIGAVTLSDPQERIIDRVNREYSEGKAFVPTDTDRRIWDYLALFRFATRSDVVRVGGWHGGYARQAPRIVRYGDLGLIIAERVPLSTLDYIQLTHDGMIMSSYDFLPDPSPTEATRGDRSHSLGLSSLASQLLTPSREYDRPGHDLLGVGDREWADLRAEIRRGDAKVIGETIYRSAWSRMRSDSHARGRSQSAVTDPRVATLMGRIFREWKSKGGAKGDTLEWVCADPESRGEFAWLWMIYGGEAVRGGERDTHGRPRHIPPSERATDERGKIIAQPGDDIITRDHPPDMVIARHRTPGGGRPRSLAIELELTGKSVADYKATMSSYMSGNGKILYSKVIWLVVQASVANMIRTGATWAGAVEGQDYIIAPVSNEENRSKDEFYDGLDMRPGSFKRTASGNAYGYAIISDLMNEMDREKEERE